MDGQFRKDTISITTICKSDMGDKNIIATEMSCDLKMVDEWLLPNKFFTSYEWYSNDVSLLWQCEEWLTIVNRQFQKDLLAVPVNARL